MKYHHIGIPTEVEQTGEIYLRDYKLYCTDHERNPFRIQWMRYESDCPLPDLVKTKAHVAFEVDDLVEALKGHEILIEPNSPSVCRPGGYERCAQTGHPFATRSKAPPFIKVGADRKHVTHVAKIHSREDF